MKEEKKYTDPVEKCAEYLRMVLPLMSKQAAGVHPLSYAVWYEHVSGINKELSAEVETLTKNGGKLDDETVRRLHDMYVAGLTEATVNRMGDNLKRVVAQVADSTTSVGEEAVQYSEKLDTFGRELEKKDMPQEELHGMVKAAFLDTVQMRAAMTSARDMLVTSQSEIDDLKRELNRVREEALQDGLTGLLNRRAFDEKIAALAKAADGQGETFAVILSDIDHFKRVNDTYGHLFGDRVIRAVGEALKAGVKGKDSVARFGGEEFAILLPATPAAGAWAVAEGVRRLVASSRIRRLNNDEVVGNITVSSGVAVHRAGEKVASLLERADAALYRAKRGGRNRVENAV